MYTHIHKNARRRKPTCYAYFRASSFRHFVFHASQKKHSLKCPKVKSPKVLSLCLRSTIPRKNGMIFRVTTIKITVFILSQQHACKKPPIQCFEQVKPLVVYGTRAMKQVLYFLNNLIT